MNPLESLDRITDRIPWYTYLFAWLLICYLVAQGLGLLDKELQKNIYVLAFAGVIIILSGVLLFIGWRQASKAQKLTNYAQSLTNDYEQSDTEIYRSTEAIDILNRISKTTARVFHESYPPDRLILELNTICQLIRAFFKNQKSKDPLVTIFIPNTEESKLHVIGFAGHTSSVLDYKPRITGENSAGYSFMTGELNYERDVTKPGARFEPNEKGNRFLSLVTESIMCGKEVVGVLSITGVEANSYDETDDIPYLKAFANTLAPLIHYKRIVGEGSKEDDPNRKSLFSTGEKTN
jgi:hypothetical protein